MYDKPKEAVVFAEDMPDVDVAALSTDNPGGLTNLQLLLLPPAACFVDRYDADE